MLTCLADILVTDDHIKDIAPFPIQYVKYDNDIAKIAIRDGSVLEKTGPGPVLRSVFTVFSP